MSGLRIGLCGCGNMGSAIAARLLTQDVTLFVFDLDREKAESTGAEVARDLGELVRGTDAVMLSLPSPAASAVVVETLAGELRPGALVVELSTVAPADAVAVAQRLGERGLRFVDAAVLSGPAQMAAGTTVLLVGGSDEDVAAAMPVLDLLGGERILFGGVGTGTAAKVAHNAVSHAVMVVLIEAASLAVAAGVDIATFAALLAREDAALLRPLQHRLRERVFENDFDGGMPMDAALKDSQLALELADAVGVPLFAIRGAHEPYELAVEDGLARSDYAALAQLWERWTGRTLRPGGAP
jgi:3-hydroxyisobutyrate dehydrogenase-like beta-hydroxyacid dehydrogenase